MSRQGGHHDRNNEGGGAQRTGAGGKPEDQEPSEEASLGPARVYDFDQIRQAHDDLEHNRNVGKLVVLVEAANGTPRSATREGDEPHR
jgi:hypothetical protein